MRVALEVEAIDVGLRLVAAGKGHMTSPFSALRAHWPNAALAARPIERPRVESMVAVVTPLAGARTPLARGGEEILRRVAASAFAI